MTYIILALIVLVLLIWSVGCTNVKKCIRKATGKCVKWRDEETDKDLASVEYIPNRYGDLPSVDHLRPKYSPGKNEIEQMANMGSSELSDLRIRIRPAPSISMVPDKSIVFEK